MSSAVLPRELHWVVFQPIAEYSCIPSMDCQNSVYNKKLINIEIINTNISDFIEDIIKDAHVCLADL